MNLRRLWLGLALLGALWALLTLLREDWGGSFASSCAGAAFYYLAARDDTFF